MIKALHMMTKVLLIMTKAFNEENCIAFNEEIHLHKTVLAFHTSGICRNTLMRSKHPRSLLQVF